jgi:hypothetical protein
VLDQAERKSGLNWKNRINKGKAENGRERDQEVRKRNGEKGGGGIEGGHYEQEVDRSHIPI